MFIPVEDCVDSCVYRLDTNDNNYGIFNSKDASFIILDKENNLCKRYHNDVAVKGVYPLSFFCKAPKGILKNPNKSKKYLQEECLV